MISIVVPIYNEGELVRELHRQVSGAMSGVDGPWEVVYVNDGSRDNTLGLLLEVQASDPHVVVVDLSRNWGHQPALTAGLSVARGDAVIMMDGDLQDPPQVLPAMIDAWRSGAQVVIAQRRSRADRGLRGLLFRGFYMLLGFLSDFPIPLNAGIFGLLDRQAVDAILNLSESNRYLPGLRAWVGYRTGIVYYDRADRAAGEPKQTLWKLLKYGLDAVFSFSYKPLRLTLLLGMTTVFALLTFAAVVLVCRVLGLGLFGQPVVFGYTSTMVAILFLGAVQLIGLGIIGEYVGRIYDEVKRRPLFLIRQVHRTEPLETTPP